MADLQASHGHRDSADQPRSRRVIAETCDKVAVMYRGKIAEAAATAQLFSNMSHPVYARPSEFDPGGGSRCGMA